MMMSLMYVSYVLNRVMCTWFERVSMLVILLNCVTLGMYQPCENIDCSSERCQILQVSLISSRITMMITLVLLNHYLSFSVCAGVWCFHLRLLCSGDGGEDVGSGNLRWTLLSGRHLEQTGLLHCHGRVRCDWSQNRLPHDTHWLYSRWDAWWRSSNIKRNSVLISDHSRVLFETASDSKCVSQSSLCLLCFYSFCCKSLVLQTQVISNNVNEETCMKLEILLKTLKFKGQV